MDMTGRKRNYNEMHKETNKALYFNVKSSFSSKETMYNRM
jgi:hypothetical protein